MRVYNTRECLFVEKEITSESELSIFGEIKNYYPKTKKMSVLIGLVRQIGFVAFLLP